MCRVCYTYTVTPLDVCQSLAMIVLVSEAEASQLAFGPILLYLGVLTYNGL